MLFIRIYLSSYYCLTCEHIQTFLASFSIFLLTIQPLTNFCIFMAAWLSSLFVGPVFFGWYVLKAIKRKRDRERHRYWDREIHIFHSIVENAWVNIYMFSIKKIFKKKISYKNSYQYLPTSQIPSYLSWFIAANPCACF